MIEDSDGFDRVGGGHPLVLDQDEVLSVLCVGGDGEVIRAEVDAGGGFVEVTEFVAMSGLLDKVDLRARRFRIHDDVGHDITLEDVSDLDAAARLIGRRVVARGVAERSGDRVARIVEPIIS